MIVRFRDAPETVNIQAFDHDDNEVDHLHSAKVIGNRIIGVRVVPGKAGEELEDITLKKIVIEVKEDETT